MDVDGDVGEDDVDEDGDGAGAGGGPDTGRATWPDMAARICSGEGWGPKSRNEVRGVSSKVADLGAMKELASVD
ncbi:MAG: hypothetical protein ACRDYV_07195, partial [Acidimicrobiia bacterium]